MRDMARRRGVARAKSHQATSEELREAGKRLKEIEQELSQIGLQPETVRGEERERRYARVLRLRGMREDFQSARPLEIPDQPNGFLLAIVMTVASFLLCTFFAGGTYGVFLLANQKPDPMSTASSFWNDMENGNYADIHTNYLSPTLRVQMGESDFVATATQADHNFGAVSNAVLASKGGDMTQTAILTYVVTRGTHITYKAKLTLVMHANSWGIDDLGAAIDPTQAGIPAPATPTPAVQPTPTDTPIGDRGMRPVVSITSGAV